MSSHKCPPVASPSQLKDQLLISEVLRQATGLSCSQQLVTTVALPSGLTSLETQTLQYTMPCINRCTTLLSEPHPAKHSCSSEVKSQRQARDCESAYSCATHLSSKARGTSR